MQLSQIVVAAKAVVRDRLSTRESIQVPVAEALANAYEIDLGCADALVSAISDSLAVGPQVLRVTDTLHELCSVSHRELGVVSIEDWVRAGLTDKIEVFGYDLVDAISAKVSRRRWNSVIAGVSTGSVGEDEVVEFIMRTELGLLIRTFCSRGGG